MNNLHQKSKISPIIFKEKRNYLQLGDKFVKVFTIVKYPPFFIEGFLSNIIGNKNFSVDMVIENLDDLDISKAMRNEMDDITKKYRAACAKNDIDEMNRLQNKVDSYKNYIAAHVQNAYTTVNVVINIYIKGDSIEEVNELVKETRTNLNAFNIQIRSIPLLQEDYFKRNSPLFLKNGLMQEENYLVGQPMSSISAAALWPFIFETLEDPEGSLIGYEANSGGKFIFNQFLYKSYPKLAKMYGRTAGNAVIVGRTGMGKTVLLNLLLFNHLIYNRKIIWIDPENKNEYLTKKVGGTYIAYGANKNIINIFDLKPISTDDDSVEDMYDTKKAIYNVVEEIKLTFKCLWPNANNHIYSLLSEIVIETYQSVGITLNGNFKALKAKDFPTFDNFSQTLNTIIENAKISERSQIEIDALEELKMYLRQITGYKGVEGEYGQYFNGHTSINQNKNSKIISFGTKNLFNVSIELQNALLRLIFNYAWAECLGNDNQESVLVIDEEHMFVRHKMLAEILSIIQRRTRKYNTVTLTGTQQVNDYLADGIKAEGKAIFDNSTYQIIMNLLKGGVEDLSQLISLSDNEKEIIESLPPHAGLFSVGNKKSVINFIATDEELQIIK